MMARHTTGTDGTRQADALPEAAWFAENIMGWENLLNENVVIDYEKAQAVIGLDPVSKIIWLCYQEAWRHWNPLTNDADALHLWRQLPAPRVLESYDTHSYAGCPFKCRWLREKGTNDRDAICRAVHAWWLAQQRVHHTGTGEETL